MSDALPKTCWCSVTHQSDRFLLGVMSHFLPPPRTHQQDHDKSKKLQIRLYLSRSGYLGASASPRFCRNGGQRHGGVFHEICPCSSKKRKIKQKKRKEDKVPHWSLYLAGRTEHIVRLLPTPLLQIPVVFGRMFKTSSPIEQSLLF